ncbi:MAG: TIGR01777 family protein [Chlorobi bacterium]|nr:TIGR01777 family protein [Chlorobiota bacterium]
MKVLVSGSTGLIGSALVSLLRSKGYEVIRLVREKSLPDENATYWDIPSGHIETKELEGMDAVVHLTGANLSAGRWTEKRKAAFHESRVRATRVLSDALAGLERPPGVFISASAIGYYGNRGSEKLSEDSPSGTGFLAELCRQWEDATNPAKAKGIRVVTARIGVVLSPRGGALKKLLPFFRLGLGGKMGGGAQYMSWISIHDLVRAFQYCLSHEDLCGLVNFVAPNPVTNAEFTRALATACRRPALLPVPGWVLKLMFGEMAEETILSSARVLPEKLRASGFDFHFPELQKALRHLLN